MKKQLSILAAISMVLVLSSCGDPAAARNQTVNQTQTVNDILNAAADGAAPAGSSEAAAETASSGRSAASVSGDYDVDLTAMNSTMVYTEVFQMMQEPDAYMGKTVKMTGTLAVYEGAGRNYYACLIADATACCAQGIEFLWAGDHSYPEDYPEEGAEITVTGTFDTYYEGDYMYCQLVDADMTF